VLVEVLVFLLVLAGMAVSATACEGVHGPELTTLSTKLSGEGKEGETITVLEGSKVKDKATLKGKDASTATGKVIYKVYSNSECKTLVTTAGEVTVSGESVPASNEEELEGGASYYWQAHYTGDSKNAESTSECTEMSTVKAKTSLSTKLSGESKEGEELIVLEGSKVKDKVTLTGTKSSTATGKVTYKVYSDKECKTLVKEAGGVTVSSGSAPASSEEELEAGKTYYWQAHYEGDSLHQESTSSCSNEVLNVKAKTTLTTTLSGESKEGTELTVLEGSKVKDKATVEGTNSSTAEGIVLYKVYSDKECKDLVAEAGKKSVSSGAATASNEEELEAGKTYYWQAHYEGDSLHQESTSSCSNEVLNVKAKTTLTTTLSGESKEGTELTVLEGTKAKDDAVLGGPNSSTAGGKVTYKVYSDKECKDLVAEAGEVTVGLGSVPGSGEEELAGGKFYYWQATYEGDSLHQKAKSSCGSEVLAVKAKMTISTSLLDEGSSGETLTSNEDLSVNDTATLSGPTSSEAAGTVTYMVYSDKECKDLVAEAGNESVMAGSALPSTEETLPAGGYYWQATYSGDALHQSSSSICGAEIDTVKATLALSTSLSGEGQASNKIAVVEGTSVIDQATLTGEDGASAGGTVTYDVYSDADCETLVAKAGEVTVTSGSVPASKEETLAPGTYYWQATYSGDSHNAASGTACGEEISEVNAATSLTTSLSGGGHEGETISVSEGTGVADTATLAGAKSSKATGNIEYNVYSDSACKDLVTDAGEVTVTSGSVPASKEETLAPGTYYWQATYSGDTSNHSSQSTCGDEVAIVKGATTLNTSLSGGGNSGDAISVQEGEGISDQASLSGSSASTAGGTIKYDVYSDKECKTLVAEAGEVTVSSGSIPRSNEEKLGAGTYYWQVHYSGDLKNENSGSVCGEEASVVRKTLLTTSLSGEGRSGGKIDIIDGAVHDTATLTGENAFMATGTVKYDVYSDKDCEHLVAEAGEVTVAAGLVPASEEEKLLAGTYYWQATYSGDLHNEGSTTPCGEEIAVIGPTPPIVEQVNFTNNMPVIIDNQHNEVPESLEAIEEYSGHNDVEWEYSPSDSELIKSWPLAYAKEATPDIRARFELPASAKQMILEKRVEGKPTIMGETILDGEAITFTKEFASVEELETQVKKHESYIEIGEAPGESPIAASKALPPRVGYEEMVIKWAWTIKTSGAPSAMTQSLGESNNELYLTFAEPAVTPCRSVTEVESVTFPEAEEVEGETEKVISPCTPIYFSSLYLSVTSVEQVRPTEAEIITDVWKRFSNKQLLPVGQRLNFPPIAVPTIRMPRWMRGRGSFGPPIIFKYYSPVPANETAQALGPWADGGWRVLGGCTTLYAMLEEGNGRCGTFAAWLLTLFQDQRVPANIVHLDVNFGPGAPACSPTEQEVCVMLVKDWKFSPAGTSGSLTFPFTSAEVTDELGIAGQGVENPPPFFWDHAIVRAGGGPGGTPRQLFDPSYGTGPIGGPGDTPATRLKAYQNAAISGFCRPTLRAHFQLPSQCVPAGAITRLAVIP
jgi:hypothetical protein